MRAVKPSRTAPTLRLLHPNTVRVFDFGEDPRTGHLFLAMELLEGKLLTAHLENEGALDVLDAIGITQEVLRSLHEAHTKGIVHRDLKPDNIFLATIEGHAAPVVKVLDFGIAKVFREEGKIDQLETQAGTVFGTPRYMSPEQAQGKALDPRSDLYSVGVLLYHLLTGHPPFVDEDAVVVMAKHIRERAQPPRKAAPDRPIPASLERVVMRAMEKDASDRFSGADAFEQALAACVHDSIAAKSALETGRRSTFGAHVGGIPRGPLVLAVALVGLAVVTSAAMIVSAGWSDPDEVDETVTLLPGPALGASATTGTIGSVPSAPAPATRSIVVDSEPTGAELWRGETLVGTTPQTLEAPSATHRARADGDRSRGRSARTAA